MAGKNRKYLYYLTKYLLAPFSDKMFHNIMGFLTHKRFGVKYHWMNLDNPSTFSEKIQYLKSEQGDALKTKTLLADKYDVRDYIISKKCVNLVDLKPLNKKGDLFVYSADDIDFDLLPDSFVLKLTKGSGFNIICNDKSVMDVVKTKKQLNEWLKVDNYAFSREPQYKGKSKIICEQMLEYNITDYKFFCFDGEPMFVELYIDRLGEHKKVFYTMDWKPAGFTTANDSMGYEVECPFEFYEMKEIAKKLSVGFKFVRVDLYINGGKIYFGELTFHPAGGYTPITPHDWDLKLGQLIKL